MLRYVTYFFILITKNLTVQHVTLRYVTLETRHNYPSHISIMLYQLVIQPVQFLVLFQPGTLKEFVIGTVLHKTKSLDDTA